MTIPFAILTLQNSTSLMNNTCSIFFFQKISRVAISCELDMAILSMQVKKLTSFLLRFIDMTDYSLFPQLDLPEIIYILIGLSWFTSY